MPHEKHGTLTRAIILVNKHSNGKATPGRISIESAEMERGELGLANVLEESDMVEREEINMVT
jgi:hypothetical protein